MQFFDIGANRKTSDIGLLYRHASRTYSFVKSVEDLRPDFLYFVYYSSTADFSHNHEFLGEDRGDDFS
jgi:hypothetical protein